MNTRKETTKTETTPSTLWLITARGGSKGIPGKNIKPLAGKPLICHTIDHALGAGAPLEDICLSTDSTEIREVAESYGLPVSFLRPAELASDTSSSYDVIMHALAFHEARGKRYERVVLLQPTSPLRTPQDILNAMALWTPEIDMAVSVIPAKTNPYYGAFEPDSDGFLRISKGDGKYTRRQDAPDVWEYNGAVYVITADSLRRGPMSGFRKVVGSPMPAERSVDLDTPFDWAVAEMLMAQSHT